MAQTRYYSQVFEDSETEELIDIYADEGITGTREDKRDEFQRMLKDCRKGKIDRIYTKSISRFARSEALPTRTIFAETRFTYDEKFWGNFNMIPPEEKLNDAIGKISSKIEETKE